MASTFAERLRWARYKGPAARREGRVMGATILARAVGCAQSLVSGLERNNAKGSEHNNAFAKALGVDPGWLATGTGQAPEGFDEAEARKMLHVGGAQLLSIVHGSPGAHGRQGAVSTAAPRWTKPPAIVEVHDEGHSQPTVAEAQRALMECFIKFVAAVGSEKALVFLDLLRTYAEALRQDTVRKNNS